MLAYLWAGTMINLRMACLNENLDNKFVNFRGGKLGFIVLCSIENVERLLINESSFAIL